MENEYTLHNFSLIIIRNSYYIHRSWCDKINFCCFMCVTQWSALHVVIKRQFFTFIFVVFQSQSIAEILLLPHLGNKWTLLWKFYFRFRFLSFNRHRHVILHRRNKNRTGQDRTVKKVTKVLYFTYLGRGPHWTDFHRNLHSGCRPRRNHVCKPLNWNFQGLRFYRGRISHFLRVLCSADALPVIYNLYSIHCSCTLLNSTLVTYDYSQHWRHEL